MKKIISNLILLTLFFALVVVVWNYKDKNSIYYYSHENGERGQKNSVVVSDRNQVIVEGREEEESKQSLFAKQKEIKKYKPEELAPLYEGNISYYYYEALEEDEKIIYQEILTALLNSEEVIVSTKDLDLIAKIYQCVMYDHPEIFYVEGYAYTRYLIDDVVDKIAFAGKYTGTKEETAAKQEMIDEYTRECMSHVGKELDQFSQIKLIYDYIIEKTDYDKDAENNQNICSVFVGHASVCQGYAEATQYLLQKLGFEVAVVTGKTEGGSHAWNLVKVDGDYYYLDTTWGDVDYQDANETEKDSKIRPINYDYFLITTEQLELTHTIVSDIAMPACVATENNYYVRMNLYFESLDEERIRECFEQARAEGKDTLTIKAANDEVFLQIKSYLLEEQNIFKYLEGSHSVAYYEENRMHTICFWLND